MDVWLLHHIPPGADENDEYMLIGVYSTREAALTAVARLRDKPGFVDHPGIVDDTYEAGFMLVSYTLDEDHWTEGYRSGADVTLTIEDS